MQICDRFVHQRKGAQLWRKIVANKIITFGQFGANTPFPMPSFGISESVFPILGHPYLGRTPKEAYSTRGRSRHLLETSFSEPLLRTLLRTLFYCKTHRKRPPSQNPSENPFPRTLPRTFSEPFSERCVAVRPLRRAPYYPNRGTSRPFPIQNHRKRRLA